jgi:hypothetical protein
MDIPDLPSGRVLRYARSSYQHPSGTGPLMRNRANVRLLRSLIIGSLFYVGLAFAFGCQPQSEMEAASQATSIHTSRIGQPFVRADGIVGRQGREGSTGADYAHFGAESGGLHTVPLSAHSDHEIARIRGEFGVQVHVIYDFESYFPREWREAAYSAQGSQIDVDESMRLIRLIPGFLSMYPAQLIRRNLRDIYLLKAMSFYGLRYGGTNSLDGIYIASRGNEPKCRDERLAGVMHAEFSSILLRNYRFPSEAWSRINDSNWRYAGTIKDLIGRSDLYSHTETLLRQGFISIYGQASVEEDVNMYIECVIEQRSFVTVAAANHKRVRQKLEILTHFFEGIKHQLGFSGEFELLTRLKSSLNPHLRAVLD